MAGERVIENLANRILYYEGQMRDHENTMDKDNSMDTVEDDKEPDTEDFVDMLRNSNTKRMTASAVRTFTAYLTTKNELRNPEEIEPVKLDKYLAGFYMTAKKSDNSDYEPSSLTNTMCSINRYLKEKKYASNIYTAQEFVHSREVLQAKRKLLKQRGLGNQKHKAEPFSDEEISRLYELNLLGKGNPQAMTNTLWLSMTMMFGLRGRQEHVSMLWGDLDLKMTTEGKEYVEYTERETKTRKGQADHSRSHAPKMFAVEGSDRCPVALYKAFRDRRPKSQLSGDSRVYLTPLLERQCESTGPWFRSSPMGKNTIGEIGKKMAEAGQLEGRKTNHSARKTAVQTLKESNVAESDIRKLTGHNHPKSLDSYYEPSVNAQRQLSTVLTEKVMQQTVHNSSSSDMQQRVHSTISTAQVSPLTSRSFGGSLFANCTFNGNLIVNMQSDGSKRPRLNQTSPSDEE